MTSMVRLAANRTSRGAGLHFAVDLNRQRPACRPKTLIIEPDTPDGEELSQCYGVGMPTLQPYLAGGPWVCTAACSARTRSIPRYAGTSTGVPSTVTRSSTRREFSLLLRGCVSSRRL